MKKLKNKRLFLIIGISLSLLFIGIIIEYLNIFHWPKIESIRLYYNENYSFGAPLNFKTIIPYSRLWDLSIIPLYFLLLIKVKKIIKGESKIITLSIILILMMISFYFLISFIFTIYASIFFIIIVAIYFGEKSALFLSLIFGLLIGLIFTGLLYGFILTIISQIITLIITRIIL